MLWSHRPEEIRHARRSFDEAGMIEQTRLVHPALERLERPTDPIDYIVIPQKAHAIGKLVLSWVNLNEGGLLSPGAPVLYGVTSRPAAFDNVSSDVRSRETHVVVEHLTHTGGIMKPSSWTGSEELGTSLIPDGYLAGYIGDRTAQLLAKKDEVSDPTFDLSKKEREIIQLGINQALGVLGRIKVERLGSS